MKCPTCGAENDQANHFCDQCGTRLDQQPVQVAPTGAAMTAGVALCPTCGSPVLPGEAFCDNCGASLTSPAPDSTASSAPLPDSTQMPATTVAASVPEGTAAPVVELSTASTSVSVPVIDASAIVTPDNTSVPAVDATVAAVNTAVDTTVAAVSTAVDTSSAVVSSAGQDTSAAPVDASTTAAPDTTSAPDSSAAPVAAPDTGMATSDYEARKKQLEDEIGRQQQVVTQLEGVQNMLGAGTPAGVVASLDEGRAALTKLQSELDSLQPPQPAIDPAELARLNDEIGRQQQVVTQLEGVQNMLGAATPAGVLADLDQARQALAKAQADLTALGGSPAPVSSPSSALAPEAASTSAAPAADASASAAPAADTSAAVAAPVASAAPSGPRLVVEGSGAVIQLPSDKNELIIGREDPISGIHPEVDLTTHGGESGGVSRQHARLSQTAGQWTLTDLNSTNHSRVDGVRLEPNTATPVNDGAKLQFGRLVMVFHKS